MAHVHNLPRVVMVSVTGWVTNVQLIQHVVPMRSVVLMDARENVSTSCHRQLLLQVRNAPNPGRVSKDFAIIVETCVITIPIVLMDKSAVAMDARGIVFIQVCCFTFAAVVTTSFNAYFNM